VVIGTCKAFAVGVLAVLWSLTDRLNAHLDALAERQAEINCENGAREIHSRSADLSHA